MSEYRARRTAPWSCRPVTAPFVPCQGTVDGDNRAGKRRGRRRSPRKATPAAGTGCDSRWGWQPKDGADVRDLAHPARYRWPRSSSITAPTTSPSRRLSSTGSCHGASAPARSSARAVYPAHPGLRVRTTGQRTPVARSHGRRRRPMADGDPRNWRAAAYRWQRLGPPRDRRGVLARRSGRSCSRGQRSTPTPTRAAGRPCRPRTMPVSPPPPSGHRP